ncbi:type I methionyl aminopeptidase [Planctomonas sp. JC2975]|uniref:type I methionyl aminopeptidase n=1 Tax=Planctomonas sp. JC2975 TaxID=2729626 RepID=UPI0014741C14|nr:type I methionyl aminopeptidase [Planctomonas sp. JC2975]NNC12317.1 type I methionyl aminopeptidase [Planctomonas sp. JC2975]
MIELHTPAEIEQLRAAGRFVHDTLVTLSARAAVGVNLLELEECARTAIADRGAVSCYWDYAPSFGNGPFRNVICLSVNDAAQHGLPHDYVLRDGDMLSLDFAASVDGWVADAAVTVIVGRADPADHRLIRSTQEALAAGIAASEPGNRIGDVSAAIGQVAADYGYPVNHEFGGHGVGRTMHEDPFICNDGRAGRGYRIRPGMVFALEPWWAKTTARIRMDPDGWTVRSADGSRAAHTEHTIAVTADGPVILT